MNYFIVRLIIPLILLIFGIVINKKLIKKNINSRLLIWFIFTCFSIFIFSMNRLDIEEKIIQFNSSALAFNYSYPSANIIKSIDKDDYKIYFYLEEPEIKYQIIKKNSINNWDYIYPKDSKKNTTFTSKYNISIYTKDRLNFIAITSPDTFENTKSVDIKDNKDSIFEKYNHKYKDDYFDITYTIYYAFVDDFDNYELYMNNILVYSN